MVTLRAARRRFDTARVGTGKTVTVTGLTLSGAAAGNYTLATTTATTTANITAVTLTPTVTAANKVYDGTTSADVELHADAASSAPTSSTLRRHGDASTRRASARARR